MKKFLPCLLKATAFGAIVTLAVPTASATDYLMHKGVAGLNNGEWYEFNGHWFVKGDNAFSSIWDVLGKIQDGDNIYFGPGAVGNITIKNNNVTLFGANAFCDAWSGQRNAEESTFTGTVTIAGGTDGVTINGFAFSGAGCVRNDNAGRGSTAVKNFSFIYNKCENTTIPMEETNAIVYLGEAWRPNNTTAGHNDPTVWASNHRYENITIAHNAFYGKNAVGQPNVIIVSGSAGKTVVSDNVFEYGGTSISMFNTCDDLKIEHNKFLKVGDHVKGLTEKTGSGGYFAIRLYYVGARTAEPLTAGICHNMFDGCQGQSSMFAPIRFYSGNSTETFIAPYAELKVNHNDFRNKTSYRSTGYNYVFYADESTAATATVDWRYNHYDQSELCFGYIRPSWEPTRTGRYFASSSEMLDSSTSTSETEGTGTLIDYYGAKTAPDGGYFGGTYPPGTRLKNQTFKATTKITTVVQSFDRDDVTGDFYFLQVQNSAINGGGPYYGKSPLVVTRGTAKHPSTGGFKETQMFLDFAGHGSNMAVLNVNGTCWMFIGGCSSATSTDPTQICILPFVEGATVDVRKNSFTYGGKTYTIKHVNRSMSSSYVRPYPSIDRDNNLYVERSRNSKGDYFTVYDLMDVFNNPATAKPIKQILMKVNSLPMTNSSRDFYVKYDEGFKTWSDQGFTISGDYIYTWEGNALTGYSGTPTPTDGKPTMIINTANWRTGEFIQRKAVLKGTVYGSSDPGPYKLNPGEPEGLKIHRESNGRASLWVGVVNGASGARQYNVFSYRLKRVNGQGFVFNQHKPERTITSQSSSLYFSSAGDTRSENLLTTNTPDVRDITGTIVGEDGDCFAVTKTAGDVVNGGHAFNVSFTPHRQKKEYNAFLRLSANGANDVLVPLSGTYSGQITGVEDIVIDNNNEKVDDLEGAEYYDLTGRRLSEPRPGMIIVRLRDGSTRKLLYQ